MLRLRNLYSSAPVIFQNSESDCLLACFTSCARKEGIPVNLAQLSGEIEVPVDGLSFRVLKEFSFTLGLDINTVKVSQGNYLEYIKMRGSVIAHLARGHFVVITYKKFSRLEIMDPAVGRTIVKEEDFNLDLSGYFAEIINRGKRRGSIRDWYPGLGRVTSSFSLVALVIFLFGLILSQTSVWMVGILPSRMIEYGILSPNSTFIIFVVLLTVLFGLFLQWQGIKKLDKNFTLKYVSKIFNNSLSRKFSFYSSKTPSMIMQKLSLRGEIRDLLLSNILPSLLGVLGSFVLLIIIFSISNRAGWGVLALSILYIIINARLARKRAIIKGKLAQKYIDFSGSASSDVENIAKILVEKRGEFSLASWMKKEWDIRDSSLKSYQISLLEYSISLLFSLLFMVWVCFCIFEESDSGDMSLGSIVSLQAVVGLFIGFLGNFQKIISGTSEVITTSERNEDLFSNEFVSYAETSDNSGYLIKFSDVNFLRNSNLIFGENFSSYVVPGERIGVEGASGSGKTTLMAGLVGLLKSEGKIFWGAGLEGSDIRIELPGMKVTGGSIREYFVNCSPDGYISSERIWEILRLVYLDDHVRKFPAGIDSKISVGASNFSSGQAQRLKLAGTLVGDPKLVVWDEGLSHLDSDTAYRVMARVFKSELFSRTTFITVNHNDYLSTLFSRRWIVRANGVDEISAS